MLELDFSFDFFVLLRWDSNSHLMMHCITDFLALIMSNPQRDPRPPSHIRKNK